MLENGSLVDGKYRILHEVGHGGMSVVYLALNERANKTWAIKEVRKDGVANFDVVHQSLIAETNILKRLNHKHLPSIIDVIDSDESFLVVMDYIEGVSLKKQLEQGPQPWQDVVKWGIQLCDVLHYLHTRMPPIVYRDMKPDNVQLKPDGDIVLMDFGTAREYKFRGKEGTDTTCLGTRGYAAPEQYGGMGETDARTDIYCLGATLYHLVTGLFPEGQPYYRMVPIRSINPNLPEGLEEIILKCTQKEPAQRYQSCTELMYALEHVHEMGPRIRKQKKRKVALFAGCLGMALLCGAGAMACRLAYHRNSDAQYENYIDQGRRYAAAVTAENDVNYNSAVSAYKSAIQLQPENATAYESLLDLYGTAITPSEYQSMATLLTTNTAFSRSADYTSFAYTYGTRLYFYYTNNPDSVVGTGSPTTAADYLQIAAEADPSALGESGEAKQQIADLMYRIARGQRALNTQNFLDESYTFATYWSDLETLLSDDQLAAQAGATTGNSSRVMLSLYKSVINAINESMTDFNSQAGKSRDEIAAMIDRVEQATQKIDRSSLDAESRNIYDYIQNQISLAREKCNTL